MLCSRTAYPPEFGHTKDIWSWTGYTWEELMRPEKPQTNLNCYISSTFSSTVYLRDQKDSLLQFRGSETSASLMCPSSGSRRTGHLGQAHDQERDIPEIYLKTRSRRSQQAS
ncbi:MAG: 4Fe-4S cluster-binding domain-containing protein [Bifidobacterium sp.]